MMTAQSKKSNMTFYSGAMDLYSHRIRFILAEKGIKPNIFLVEELTAEEKNEFLLQFPLTEDLYPIFIDRNLVIHEIPYSGTIIGYLDERFPYPPLLPINPRQRVKYRMAILYIEKEWYPIVSTLQTEDPQRTIEETKRLQLHLQEHLTRSAPLLKVLKESLAPTPTELTLVDCTMAPLLWRLPHIHVPIPKSLEKYAEMLLSRPGFQASLTDLEQEMQLPATNPSTNIVHEETE